MFALKFRNILTLVKGGLLLIKIENLFFSYTGEEPYLLNNINLNIPSGSYISIIGENGSCKTTLIKLILNLLQPIKGSITIASNEIGYVPQRLDSLNNEFPISIEEILKIHATSINCPKEEINSTLKKVNMIPFKNTLIGNLSGGQQQRVFIARALMNTPNLLILDEPSTGVDKNTQKDIYNLLYNLNSDLKTTILSIEHNLDIALKYSTHILEVKNRNCILYTIDEFKKLVS